MVYCPQCGTEVENLVTVEMWKYIPLKLASVKQDSVPACFKCTIKIAIRYINKKHYISLKHSSVKTKSDLIL